MKLKKVKTIFIVLGIVLLVASCLLPQGYAVGWIRESSIALIICSLSRTWTKTHSIVVLIFLYLAVLTGDLVNAFPEICAPLESIPHYICAMFTVDMILENIAKQNE